MTHNVSTLAEAATMLDYFSGFHDGSIKKFSVLPHEAVIEQGDEACWDGLDVEVVFSHSNYRQCAPR